MFPVESLPPTLSDERALARKGFKYQFTWELGHRGFPDYDRQRPRARANYLGMLRLIDDQIARFCEFLDARGLRENTHPRFCRRPRRLCGRVRPGPQRPRGARSPDARAR